MTAQPKRFLALDVFRGMTICFMIIVNTPGNGATSFSPLQHAHWNGFTPTDLVFPSFLFAVGNALSFVMLKWENMKQSEVLWKIFRRTFMIFLLGYLMYWFPFVKMDIHNNIVGFPISETRGVWGIAKDRTLLRYRCLNAVLPETQNNGYFVCDLFISLLDIIVCVGRSCFAAEPGRKCRTKHRSPAARG